MFGKDPEKMESFLGRTPPSRRAEGERTLRVDGRAEGRLEAECVVLSESGRVKGEVKAGS